MQAPLIKSGPDAGLAPDQDLFIERHELGAIPVPMSKTGVLIEVEFGRVKSTLHLPGSGIYNTPVASVRALAPTISELAAELLPDGNGAVGARVVFSYDNARYLLGPEYDALGLDRPVPEENGLGDLAFINYERLIALVPSDNAPVDMTLTTLPFAPLGARVFFEFDMDDESIADVEVGSLIVREKDLAGDNQLATVTAVGPMCEHLAVGDRVVVKRSHHGISYEGTDYAFVSNEHEVFAKLLA